MSGEKTEEPTERRLEDQRKEGQLPSRKNVIEAAYLFFSVIILMSLFGRFSEASLSLMDIAVKSIPMEFEAGIARTSEAALQVALPVVIFCAAGSAFVLLMGLLLNRFNFAPKAVTPKFSKLNPVSNLKGLFSKSTLYSFGRLIVIFLSISGILYEVVRKNFENSINSAVCGQYCMSVLFLYLNRVVVFSIISVFIVLAILDVRVQNLLFRAQNKMSKDDIKREHKSQEGDPHIKSARKSIASQDVHLPSPKEATHVVRSDELLVAVIYYERNGTSPFVIAKAKGPHVLAIARKYAAYKIPVVNLPAIASDFFRMARIGQYMPPSSAYGMARILKSLES